jgi:sugar-specific transcriptional regulator TrmB
MSKKEELKKYLIDSSKRENLEKFIDAKIRDIDVEHALKEAKSKNEQFKSRISELSHTNDGSTFTIKFETVITYPSKIEGYNVLI